MAIRATACILGTRTPCVVDCISRIEEASGVVVPIPTLFCALRPSVAKTIAQISTNFFMNERVELWLFHGETKIA
jgi:hypothetical protein